MFVITNLETVPRFERGGRTRTVDASNGGTRRMAERVELWNASNGGRVEWWNAMNGGRVEGCPRSNTEGVR